VKVNAIADAEILSHFLKRRDEAAATCKVKAPVDAGREGSLTSLELGEGADEPIDSLVGFDPADGEHAKLSVYRADASGCGFGAGDWAQAAHAGDLGVAVEVFSAFTAKIFAGDDGVAAAA